MMTADEVERLASRHTIEANAWSSDGAIHDLARFHRQTAAALRALVAERDAARAERDAARAEAARLREALEMAADWFEIYAEDHQSAGALDKAARNLERANACRRAALSRHANPEEQG